MRTRVRNKKAMGELVPIASERLHALIRARDVSFRALSERLNRGRRSGQLCAPSTLMHICSGRQQRCRAPLRTRLAQLLDVTEAWLAGEAVPGPTLNDAILEAWAERDTRLGGVIPGGWWIPFNAIPLDSRSEIEAAALLRAIWKLDPTTKQCEPDTPHFEGGFVGLVRLDELRRLLRDGHGDVPVSDEEYREFSRAIVRALGIVLRPWLDGDEAYTPSVATAVHSAAARLHALVEPFRRDREELGEFDDTEEAIESVR